MGVCIWLDGSVTKACRVLKARLKQFGVEVVCRTSLPDELIDELARTKGCIVVSTDKRGATFGWIVIDHAWIERKSSRDIASRVVKLVFGRVRSPSLYSSESELREQGR